MSPNFDEDYKIKLLKGASSKEVISDWRETPERYKKQDPSYVDRMILSSTPEEPFQIKMIQRQTRVPEVGDKFSSRHG